MTLRILAVILLVTAVSSFAQVRRDDNSKQLWGRSVISERIPDKKSRHLELQDITQEAVHLVGLLALSKDSSGGAGLVVEGHLDKAGTFVANASLEVSNDETKNWESIESSLSNTIELTLTASRKVSSVGIPVRLDAFEPYIGKYRFGRVVLQTGEAAVFSLLELTENRGQQ